MTDTPIAVTIGFPVYNVERYVEEALLSALEQDFQYPYEILVVDDCGTDGSMDIVRRLASTHKRGYSVRIISHKSNLGLGHGRNTIINNTKGRFLFFLDSDDVMAPDALSVMYARAIETGADLTIGSIICTHNNDSAGVYRAYRDITSFREHAGIYLLTSKGINIHGEMWGKLWSSDFLRRSGITCIHRIFEDAVPDFVSGVESSSIDLLSATVYYYRYERASSILTDAFKKKKDDLVFTMASIINSIQALVVNKYRDVPGIYDLYLKRVHNCYRAMLNSKATMEQLSFFNARIRGCFSIIPSVWSLKTWRCRLLYLICRKRDSVEQYSKYDKTATIIAKILSSLKKLLHNSIKTG